MKWLAACAVCVITLLVAHPTRAEAISLRITPLEYRVTLKSGEKQKGMIDVSNPTGEKIMVTTSVQAFRQIDNTGALEFYDDEQFSTGIQTDLKEFELGPRETMRMYFLVDSTKLPSGEIYGVIFFSTKLGSGESGVSQASKLGTILSIVNGTPSSKQAVITKLDTKFFHFGTTIDGSYSVKNIGNPLTSTGFYPEVILALDPLQTKHTTTGKLVFAGRTRSNSFSLKDSRLGFYRLSASFGEQRQSRWIFAATGIWRWVMLGVVIVVLLRIAYAVIKPRKKRYILWNR